MADTRKFKRGDLVQKSPENFVGHVLADADHPPVMPSQTTLTVEAYQVTFGTLTTIVPADELSVFP